MPRTVSPSHRNLLLSPPAGDAGVEVARRFAGAPDAEGVLLSRGVEVPAFRQGCYYACSQKHDPLGQTNTYWPGGANRMQPLRIEHFEGLTHGGMFLTLQLTDGSHLALLPLVGPGTAAYFRSHEDRLVLDVATFGRDAIEADLPLLAWARAGDAYGAARRAWQTALAHPLIAGSTQARAAKHYPEPFTYLGWCTWEQYKKDIDEKMLQDALDRLEASRLPIRYVLIDDGHLHHQDKRLLSIEPERTKFPHVWDRLLARRNPDGLKWFGLWLNFNGYWGAIAPDNELGELNSHLAPVESGALKPADGFTASMAFYDAMIGATRAAGFDFVKVDDQAQALQQYAGTAQPLKQAAEDSQALEAACARHVGGLINCMAHNSVCIFNTRLSAVTRCSEDYKVNDAWRAKAHLHNSFANMLWCGQTVWGDHDMFHSNDPLAGRPMAISKAISGGPIYLSDEPSDFDSANVWPLCLSDGKLLRPLAPGGPLPDSIYINPFSDAAAYRTVAPLPNDAAALAVFNLTEPDVAVSGTIRPADYTAATGLMDPAQTWAVPDEGLVLYDWQTSQARRLTDAQPEPFTLDCFGCLLYLLCPVRQGWAVIGRPDKFLSPAAVEVLFVAADELILRTPEAGPLVLWSEATFASPDGLTVTAMGSSRWQVQVTADKAGQPLRLRR